MGLDVTAFQHLKFVEDMRIEESWEEKYLDEGGKIISIDTVCLTIEQPYPDRLAPLSVPSQGFAVYEVLDQVWSFRVGPHRYYNQWRNRLSLLVTHMSAEQIWQTRELRTTRELPFYLLIDFSDCEGAIGPYAARKITDDFASFQSEIDKRTDDFRALYADFRKAFELAAERGAVLFH